ncbi:hypothetical protein O181_064202 [Austropuccinia psidii MF-1]|uniref:Uncharacterized protein n=1 Tax=Austropuccinia psidii MF-1 TaxID=1389203 RepID=A0A9Q3I229_9BASI|nr:hypothetical protein [Austropuccinia psidii MF-1]
MGYSEEDDEDAPEFDEEENLIKPHPGFGAKHMNSLNFPGIQVPKKQQGFWKRIQEYLSTMKEPESRSDAVEWHKISTTEELLEARTKQLEGKEEMRKKLSEKLKKSREESMKYWDRRMAHQVRSQLNPGDLVMVYRKAIETNWGLILKNK